MRLAWRELRRRPGRFAIATAVLTVLAVLLMFLGSLLDGLVGSQTGAYRAQRADLVVYSADARQSLVRSRLTADVLARIAAVPGVAQVGRLGSAQLGSRRQSEGDPRRLISTAVLGYDLAPAGLPAEPPPLGQAIADRSATAKGVRTGDVLLVGPARTPITVVGFVDDTRFSGQSTLWTSLATWRQVVAANRPDLALGDSTVQAAVVVVRGAASGAVAQAIDAATQGATTTLTRQQAIEALPGVSQQRATFTQIIGVTALIVLIVVALFFALITLERLGLYGILKAIGASSSRLFAGVLVQAVAIALASSLVGVLTTLLLAAVIPAGTIPFQVTPARLASSVALMVAAAVFGSAFSLRRVLRVDPASAIGAGT